MRKLLTLSAVVLSFGVSAQELSGKATYQTKTIFNWNNIKPENDTPELREQLKATEKATEKIQFLEFTKDESIYTEDEKLPTGFTSRDGTPATVSMNSGWKKIYKNLKENYILVDNNEDYILKDSLHFNGWELSTESKQIGNYTVYKAIRTIKRIRTKTDNNFLSTAENKEPKDIVYTAWYTPEIPIPNGPEKFGGLPGLILELRTSSRVYLCSEIVLNPQKPVAIKIPKGKILSKEEYDKMEEKLRPIRQRQMEADLLRRANRSN